MKSFYKKITIYFLLPLFLSLQVVEVPMVEQRKASSGNHYTIIHKGDAFIKYTTTRPAKEDKKVLCCIAAAFTRLDDGKVDGAYAVDGKIGNANINRRLGGTIMLQGNIYSIQPLDTSMGKKLKPVFQGEIEINKASFFQQIQLIVNGKAEKFKDTQLFQRRAIVTFMNAKTKRVNKLAIIESKEPITLAAFSSDLVELGAYNALYTDMGAWDEGWYRDKSGKIITIGTSLTQTAKQSNWITFVK